MVNKYFCPRCSFKTHIKTHLTRHLYRKTPCLCMSGGYDIEYLKQQLQLGNINMFVKQLAQNDSQMAPKCSHLTPVLAQNDSELTPFAQNDSELTLLAQNDSLSESEDEHSDDEQSNTSNKKCVCQYCSKVLSKKSNLSRHLKTCHHNPLGDKCDPLLAVKALTGLTTVGSTVLFTNLYQKLQALEERLQRSEDLTIRQYQELQKKEQALQDARKEISQLIPKVGNYNNNIVIVNFGNETLDHLDYTDIKNLIESKGAYGALPHIFEQIYFNDKAPQNKTIKIPNLNKPKLAIHHGGKWVQKDKEYILNIAAEKTTNLALDIHPNKITKVKEEYQDKDGMSKKRIQGDIFNVIETDHRNKFN